MLYALTPVTAMCGFRHFLEIDRCLSHLMPVSYEKYFSGIGKGDKALERLFTTLYTMLTIPFCIIGVVMGLLLFGSTLSLLSLLGIISLGGVVVNNGIILIDYVNLCRERNPLGDGEDAHASRMGGMTGKSEPVHWTGWNLRG